jgi:hypothetical protein
MRYLRSMKLALLTVLALNLGTAVFAQAGFARKEAPKAYQGYSDTTWRVCASNDASPCTNTAIYTAASMATAVTQPTTLAQDTKAAEFFAPAGIYNLQWYSSTYGHYFNETIQVSSPTAIKLCTKIGFTALSIGNNTATALTNAACTLPAGILNTAGRHLRLRIEGEYTNAAATTLNADIRLCTVSGCASGTVVTPAGCDVVSASQANNVTDGQWIVTCDLVTVGTGASGTLNAKAVSCYNIGANTAAVLSCYADTATAVSAAVDLTVAEYLTVFWTFGTGNASNFAEINHMSVELMQN